MLVVGNSLLACTDLLTSIVIAFASKPELIDHDRSMSLKVSLNCKIQCRINRIQSRESVSTKMNYRIDLHTFPRIVVFNFIYNLFKFIECDSVIINIHSLFVNYSKVITCEKSTISSFFSFISFLVIYITACIYVYYMDCTSAVFCMFLN